MTAGCSRFLSVGEYVYREPSVSAHFWQTAFIMGFSLLSASEFLQTEKWRCAKQ